MIKYVIKRNGDKQVFSEDKIKKAIEAAAKEALIPEEKARVLAAGISDKILKELENKEEVSSQVIRGKVLEELERTERKVADSWRRYEGIKRKNRQEL